MPTPPRALRLRDPRMPRSVLTDWPCADARPGSDTTCCCTHGSLGCRCKGRSRRHPRRHLQDLGLQAWTLALDRLITLTSGSSGSRLEPYGCPIWPTETILPSPAVTSRPLGAKIL
jgi:hypothetical protein